MTALYKALIPAELIQHDLDSMTLIFQKASGITHIVADPIPAILEVMGQELLSALEIGARLVDSFDLEDDALEGGSMEDVVIARLEELRLLGLVERVSAA